MYKNYYEISLFPLINEVETEKVENIITSIKENGWQGLPILIYGDNLLTGSHRLQALKILEEQDECLDVLDEEIAYDVTDIVEDNLQKYEDENGFMPEIDFSDIGWLLQGSWLEEYKNEIIEW